MALLVAFLGFCFMVIGVASLLLYVNITVKESRSVKPLRRRWP